MAYHLTGTLRHGSAPGTVEAELHDDFGTSFIITGTKAAVGYDLIAVPGPIPEGLRIPFLDDDEAGE